MSDLAVISALLQSNRVQSDEGKINIGAATKMCVCVCVCVCVFEREHVCVGWCVCVSAAYLRNWLLAVLGSPTMHTLMSPLSEVPSMVVLPTPPNSMSSTPRFTSSLPAATHTKQQQQQKR